jgi:hypothetical protein
MGLILSKTVSKLGKLLINLHNNISTNEVLAQNILGFGHRNLEFEPGTSDLFNRFFGTFLVKKNMEPKQWHKMKKFKRHILAYKITNFYAILKI